MAEGPGLPLPGCSLPSRCYKGGWQPSFLASSASLHISVLESRSGLGCGQLQKSVGCPRCQLDPPPAPAPATETHINRGHRHPWRIAGKFVLVLHGARALWAAAVPGTTGSVSSTCMFALVIDCCSPAVWSQTPRLISSLRSLHLHKADSEVPAAQGAKLQW